LDDLRQQPATWAEQGQRFWAEQPSAAQEGAPARTAAQDNVPEPIQRVEKQAARIEKFFAQHEPKRGKRGKE
jgi:hypothetical protein